MGCIGLVGRRPVDSFHGDGIDGGDGDNMHEDDLLKHSTLLRKLVKVWGFHLCTRDDSRIYLLHICQCSIYAQIILKAQRPIYVFTLYNYYCDLFFNLYLK